MKTRDFALSTVRVALLAAAVILPVSAPAFGACPGDLRIVGLTGDQRLIGWSEDRPGGATRIGPVAGLAGDSRLIGIDFRPATGELWGLGNAGGLYSIDSTNGLATFRSQLSVALDGSGFGVDFNPTVDRLRIVSNSGQNLRVNVDTGAATVDTALTYTGPALGVGGAAYTNNDLDAETSTTLFVIDSNLDQVAIQAPPNNGTLNLSGKLSADVGPNVGFDIYSNLTGTRTTDNCAFAALTTAGSARFYTIDVLTGQASLRGAFRAANQVIDIAIPTAQP